MNNSENQQIKAGTLDRNIEIERRVSAGRTQASLGREYGICRERIRQIVVLVRLNRQEAFWLSNREVKDEKVPNALHRLSRFIRQYFRHG